MRLIDADAISDKVEQTYKPLTGQARAVASMMLDYITDAPTVDSAPCGWISANDRLQLLPCPFCGVSAGIAKEKGSINAWFSAYCMNEDCSVRPETHKFYSREQAIEAWNNRPYHVAQWGKEHIPGKPVRYMCSKCKCFSDSRTDYCPHCGRQMDIWRVKRRRNPNG